MTSAEQPPATVSTDTDCTESAQPDAYGYTRLSEESDTSIEQQKVEIREYASEAGLALVDILDDGEWSSGYDTGRDAYRDLVERVRDGKVDAVIVRGTDRLGRVYDERELLKIWMRKTDTELHDTRRGHVDIQDVWRASVEGIRAAADDQQKRKEIEQAVDETERRIEAGYWQGRPPFGLEFDDDKQYLVPGEGFDAAITAIRAHRAGVSVRDAGAKAELSRGTTERVLSHADEYLAVDADADARIGYQWQVVGD
jgi:DNA invertase Pin-like site-specific DNA recombinase